MFESAPCSILRSTADDDDMFEEAELEVGLHVDHEGDRLVEISVLQPDDYDEPSGGTIETTLYLSAPHARMLVRGLQQAIKGADVEIARRATPKAKRYQAAAQRKAVRKALNEATSNGAPARPDPRAAAREARKAEAAKSAAEAATKRAETQAKKEKREALASTLDELRGANRGRRTPKKGT